MNKSIEKLFNQALAEFTAENKHATIIVPDTLQRDFVEKFAELIVKRCIQVCDGNHEYKNRTDTDFGKGVSVGIQMSKEQIKEHFGVEE